MSKILIHTSVDDLHGHFKCSIKHHTEKEFEAAINEEIRTQNRISVVKLLQRALKKKKEKAEHI